MERKVLSQADNDIVMLGEKLSDKHMNFAQALIKNHFDNLLGLHSTLTIFQLQTPIVSDNVLQILHICGDHWMVIIVWWHQTLVVLQGGELI